jgi:hypothetical protein
VVMEECLPAYDEKEKYFFWLGCYIIVDSFGGYFPSTLVILRYWYAFFMALI